MEYPLTFEHYQQGLAEGKFLGLNCQGCGRVIFPPQGLCPGCGGEKLAKTEIAKEGVIRTFTVIRVAPEGMVPPYVLALVELSQGPWVLGRIAHLDLQQADMGLIGKKVHLGVQTLTDSNGKKNLILTFTLP